VLLAAGDSFATQFGRVIVFALALVPALPGILISIRRWRWRIVVPFSAVVAVASPQLISFAIALHSHDPFLTFRDVPSGGLGVATRSGLLAAIPLLIPLLAILLAGLHQKRPLWISYPVGTTVAWFLLAKNDLWGADQEPYQLWVAGFTLTAFTIIPVAVDVACSYFPLRKDTSGSRLLRVCQIAVPSLLVLSVAVFAVSAVDWFKFYQSQEGRSLSLNTPQDLAMTAVSSHVTNHELVMTDLCINPEYYKAITGASVDYYSAGLAWPARKGVLDRVNAAVTSGSLTSAMVKDAKIGWLITVTTCSDRWPQRYSQMLVPVAQRRYGNGAQDTIVLWRFKK
jgi:hypothetical protein